MTTDRDAPWQMRSIAVRWLFSCNTNQMQMEEDLTYIVYLCACLDSLCVFADPPPVASMQLVSCSDGRLVVLAVSTTNNGRKSVRSFCAFL